MSSNRKVPLARKAPLLAQSWPFHNIEEFKKFHTRLHERFGKYITSGRGRKRASSTVFLGNLSEGALRGRAFSGLLRGILAEKLLPRFFAAFTQKKRDKVLFVTLATKQFAYQLSGGVPFNPSKLREWGQSILEGLDYLAVIEPALYRNWGSTDSSGRSVATVCWHIHAIVRTSTPNAVRRDINKRIAPFEPFIPGWRTAHFRATPPADLSQRILYALKLPRTTYSVFKKTRDVINPETGEITQRFSWKQKKRAIRIGEVLDLAEATGRLRIRDLVWADGSVKRELCSAFAETKKAVVDRFARDVDPVRLKKIGL